MRYKCSWPWMAGMVLTVIKYTLLSNMSYYSTITSFYHIRTRERAKYESVLHCSKRIAL